MAERNKNIANAGIRLVIAEKPSVAQSIANVLGARKRQDGYLEGNGYIVSWCVGHLVELAMPESYDEKYSRWRCDDLPILPEHWKYQVSASTRKQYAVLKELMNRPDVTELVNACDSGREGELIFRLVYNQSRCKKPFRRLWISSMEDAAIREGFAHLKSGKEYDALYEAALCRERADWIVGMNATRLFSCLYGQTLNVGRVMTPTLAMVVMRDAAIQGFREEPFYTVQICAEDLKATSARFKERTDAEKLAHICRNEGIMTIQDVEQKEKTEKCPMLYDLTSLQRDANRRLGYTAQQTLDYTQNLYEKKLVTYPRTDSRYLTEDMEQMIPELVSSIQSAFDIQKKIPVSVHSSQVINGKKVSDHHAIIPTKTAAGCNLAELPSGERKILLLIARRLLSAVSDPFRYLETKVILICGGQEFSTKGKQIISEGWKVYDGKSNKEPAQEDEGENSVFPALLEHSQKKLADVVIKEGKTSPPKHFTEDTLLSSMETAGDVPDEAERQGIGTPATRAGIIEKLVQKGYVERQGDKKNKYLVSTHKGNALVTVIPEQIQSASMTAEWEEKLLQVERGLYDGESFMKDITGMISGLVKNYEMVKGAEILLPAKGTVLGNCPVCGSEVTERQKGWFCSNQSCQFSLWKDNNYFKKLGKQLTPKLAEELVKKGKARLIGCKSARTGKKYDATVVMNTDEAGKPVFELCFDQITDKKKN